MQLRDIYDHGWYWRNPDLGYPYGQNGSVFPELNVSHVLLVKLLGLFSPDPYTPGVIYFVAGFPLAALTMYFLASTQGIKRLPATVIGALFASAPGHQERFEHLWLASYWVIPLGLWVSLEVLRGRTLLLRHQDARGVRSVLTSRNLTLFASLTLVGLSGVYYSAFVLILMTVAMIGRRWIARSALGWLPGLGAIAYLLGVVLIPLLVAKVGASGEAVTGRLPATRHFVESELYAGKFMDLVMPWTGHRMDGLAYLTFGYNGRGLPTVETAALGLVAVLGLGGLVLHVARAMLASRPLDPKLARWAVLGAVSFGFYTVGGLGSFAALFVTPQLRTWSRLSVILMAIGLLATGHALVAIGRSGGLLRATVVASAVLSVGVLDQTNPQRAPAYGQIERQFAQLSGYTKDLRAAVGSDCAVFQLPVVQFPEAAGLDRLGPYDQLLPYLTSHGLSWSFGAMRGTAAGDWQLAIDPSQPGEMVRELSALGFCAIEVNNKGFDGSTDARRDLEAHLGPPVADTPESDRVAYKLPALERSADAARRALGPVIVSLDAYAVRREDAGPTQWVGPTSALRAVNLSKADVALQLSISVRGAGHAERVLRVVRENGETVTRATVPGGGEAQVQVNIIAAPGMNYLRIHLGGKLIRMTDPVITVAGEAWNLQATSFTDDVRAVVLADQVSDGVVVP